MYPKGYFSVASLTSLPKCLWHQKEHALFSVPPAGPQHFPHCLHCRCLSLTCLHWGFRVLSRYHLRQSLCRVHARQWTWRVKETGRHLERLKSTEWKWGVDGMRLKMRVDWDQVTQDSKCIVKPRRCFELGGRGWDRSLDGSILKRPHDKSRVSSCYGDEPSHTHVLFQGGIYFCCTFVTALLAEHLWDMFRQHHGVGIRKEGMASERMETMTLILKALNSLVLARALLDAGGRHPPGK